MDACSTYVNPDPRGYDLLCYVPHGTLSKKQIKILQKRKRYLPQVVHTYMCFNNTGQYAPWVCAKKVDACRKFFKAEITLSNGIKCFLALYNQKDSRQLIEFQDWYFTDIVAGFIKELQERAKQYIQSIGGTYQQPEPLSAKKYVEKAIRDLQKDIEINLNIKPDEVKWPNPSEVVEKVKAGLIPEAWLVAAEAAQEPQPSTPPLVGQQGSGDDAQVVSAGDGDSDGGDSGEESDSDDSDDSGEDDADDVDIQEELACPLLPAIATLEEVKREMDGSTMAWSSLGAEPVDPTTPLASLFVDAEPNQHNTLKRNIGVFNRQATWVNKTNPARTQHEQPADKGKNFLSIQGLTRHQTFATVEPDKMALGSLGAAFASYAKSNGDELQDKHKSSLRDWFQRFSYVLGRTATADHGRDSFVVTGQSPVSLSKVLMNSTCLTKKSSTTFRRC